MELNFEQDKIIKSKRNFKKDLIVGVVSLGLLALVGVANIIFAPVGLALNAIQVVGGLFAASTLVFSTAAIADWSVFRDVKPTENKTIDNNETKVIKTTKEKIQVLDMPAKTKNVKQSEQTKEE